MLNEFLIVIILVSVVILPPTCVASLSNTIQQLHRKSMYRILLYEVYL